MQYENNASFALELDKQDKLAQYRDKFFIPEVKGRQALYFTGNSLGLQPKSVKDHLNRELLDWAFYGVEGHFHAKNPWFHYHKFLTEASAKIVGAKPIEVVHMNGLTANIHFLFVSFYQPKGNRYKIIMEAKAFPSDQYAVESQVRFHGYDPADAIVEVAPRDGEHTIREEDIYAAIEKHKDEVALVFFGGVNYYTGQLFDMESITKAGHNAGAMVGFDLAHAAGNVKLDLHNWGADFAAWCSYKYLNSGPGGISGVFVHERHANSPDLPRFAGWWGYKEDTRFLMEKGYVPMEGAAGWQLSNAPVLSMAAHKASLEIFDEVGMDALNEKAEKLTGYLEFIVNDIASKHNANFEIITPKDPKNRGCQLSILMHGQGKELFDTLTEEGVIADWREPNVIRMAPVPLYNSFEDIYRFGHILEENITS